MPYVVFVKKKVKQKVPEKLCRHASTETNEVEDKQGRSNRESKSQKRKKKKKKHRNLKCSS